MTETRSTCPYCGVGCGVIIEAEGDQITGVRGDPAHPANRGRLCSKGSTLHLSATRAVTWQTRLLSPQRRAQRGGPLAGLSWDAALDEAADRFAAIIDVEGPDAVGFYLSGQLLTEDYHVYNKLARGLIGTNNIDSNSRLCMSSAVAGYKATLGADAPPACYDDVAHAATLFITGSNTAHAHPVLFRRIEDARAANPALRLIVVDPRRTATADVADLHLQITPGTDVALCNGMLHLMLWEGLTDPDYIAAHTSGFDALRERVREATPRAVAAACGIQEAALIQAARWFAGLDDGSARRARRPTLSLYCQGLNQSSHGTDNNAALINLHLATGQIGRPGAGPLSLTGQPNAMGGREVGAMANLLSGHRDLRNKAHRVEIARLWGLEGDLPATPGKTAIELFEAVADGQVKALWIACTNPAQSMPNQILVRRALERAEYVVVQEAFATAATCAWADLLLPASTWGEKNGTVTNSERCISRVRPAVAAPGLARDDWRIGADFARRLQKRLPARGLHFDAPDVEAVWLEHREGTRGRDLDITGLSYARLEAEPSQWPCPEGQSQGRARLYEDGIFPTPDGRARFVDTVPQGPAEPRDARYPFVLNTGRLRDQWHGMTRTGTVARLFGHVPEPAVEMHPQDMARLQLEDGDLVYVTSRRGAVVIAAQASSQVAPTQAFIAMHWGEEYLSGRTAMGNRVAGVNTLTTDARCPTSRQPELKHAAVKLIRAELPWRLLAVSWVAHDRVLAVREQLRPLLADFAFAVNVPFGRDRSGVLVRAAAHEAPPAELLSRIEAVLGLEASGTLRYADARKGQRRSVRLLRENGVQRLDAFLLGGDTRAEAWIKVLLQDALPADPYGRLLLVPGAKAPVAVRGRGRQVCSCLDVSAAAIETVLACAAEGGEADEAQQLRVLQSQLRCGTQCGSCLPELKRMIRQTLPVTDP